LRYLRQRDKFRCGPIAIHNALKWQGLQVSSTNLDQLCELANCLPVHPRGLRGTYLSDFDRIAKAFGYRRLRSPSLEAISKHLKKGNAIIVLAITDDWGHYMLVTEKRGHRYYSVNDNKKDGHAWCKPSEFDRRKFKNFYAWIVEPLKVGKMIFRPNRNAA
jgi:ABC-type bacteriocin/lantibiotic exporter with double-glycine peptidase domain